MKKLPREKYLQVPAKTTDNSHFIHVRIQNRNENTPSKLPLNLNITSVQIQTHLSTELSELPTKLPKLTKLSDNLLPLTTDCKFILVKAQRPENRTKGISLSLMFFEFGKEHAINYYEVVFFKYLIGEDCRIEIFGNK